MIQKTPAKHKLLKWIGGIAAFLIFIAAIASIYLNAKWKPFLTEKIKTGVFEGSHHLYRLDFTDLHLNVLTGSATLDSVKLLPDTAVFNQLKKSRKAPIHLFEVRMAKLRVTRIGILTAYFKKRINMNAIILDHPSINMIHYKLPKQIDTVKDQKTLYQQISESLKSIHIRTIKVLNADFDYLNGESGKTLNSVRKLNINVIDVLIDSLSQFDNSRFYYTKDVVFEIAAYKSVSKDKMYTFKVDSITGSASKGNVRVKRLQVIPAYADPLVFSRKSAHQKDCFDLSFESLVFKGLDFPRLNAEGILSAKSVTIGPAKVNDFMNRELPPLNVNKGNNFPHVALQRVSIPLIIDTVFLKNVDVAYTEYNPIARKRGTVFIDDINGKILNVTNDSLQISKNKYAVASLKARVIKAADLDIHINFNLAATNGAFQYQGNVGSFNMRALNPLAESLGLVEIKSGQIQKVQFDVNANESGSTGTLRMHYTGLKVELLKEGEQGEPMKKKGLLSFLANTFVIKDDNPGKGEALRVAKIRFERTPSASFFNLLWKSVFVGIRETIGIGAIKPKSPEKAHEKVVEKKKERQEKKQEQSKSK